MARTTMDGEKPKKNSNFTYGSGNAPTAKKVVVKQDMIDFIKAQGMDRALKRAGSIQAKGTRGEAEFIEGVRRMYGAARLNAATKAASTPAKSTAGKGRASRGMGGSTPSMPGKGPAVRVATSAAAKKKNENPLGGFSMLARAVTSGAPKSAEKAAYLEAEKKRVAAARKKEAAARAARAASRNK